MKTMRLALILCALAVTALAQTTLTVTIAQNESLSSAIQLRPNSSGNACTPAAILIPSTWVTATTMTFQASDTGVSGTYAELVDEYGSAVAITVAASKYIRLSPGDWWGVNWLKVRSGTSGSPTNQTEAAGVVIKIICK
jgi:hypothetical protein